MSRLYVIGISHKTAKLEVREVFSLPQEALRKRLGELKGVVDEAMLVSTCNRFEVYLVAKTDGICDQVEASLLSEHPQAKGHLYRHREEAALRHLFRVSSSLDSVVVGEAQILGQVKGAYSTAQEVGTLGPLLSQLVQKSFHVAKRVRTETRIGENSASIASVAVNLASHIFGDLSGQPVLVIGAGKMAELSARHLKEAKIGDLWVVNRTRSRAESLATQLGGKAHAWTDLETLLTKAAVVISSTGATEPILRQELVARVMRARRGRWLLLLDIAVPRDIEPSVGDLENVYLYDIDALQEALSENLQSRHREADSAEQIVFEELRRFRAEERAKGVVPTIVKLREHAQSIARAEVDRLLPRLTSANDRDRQLISQMAEGIVNKLLHVPLSTLKKDAAHSTTSETTPRTLEEAVRRLFNLDPTDGT